MYTLTISRVTLNNLQLNDSIFTSGEGSEIYFIPTATIDLLLKRISVNSELNNITYIKNVLELVSYIVRNNNKPINSVSLQSIVAQYQEILTSYNRTFIDKRKPYSDKTCFTYILRHIDEWSFVLLENSKNDSIKTFSNELDEKHPANNDNYIYTLCNAQIDAKSAIIANYELLKLKPFEEHPVLKHGPITISSFVSRINNILRFKNHRYIKKGKNTNRIFSSFILDRISRKYIKINNQPFYEIDIKNCQPLLLAVLLLSNKYAVDQQFIKDVVTGVFYAKFQETAYFMQIESESIFNTDTKKLDMYYFSDYDSVKQLIYRSVLFGCKDANKSNTSKIFQQLYPKTYDSCIKINNDISLALTLQNKEAEVIFSIIPNCYYYTVHDAIYVVDKKELTKIQTLLNKIIYKLSNELIEDIQYKIQDNSPIYFVTEVFKNEEPQKIIIENKRKPHKPQENKTKRLEEFRELFCKLDKKTLIKTLNISEKTYTRYKKQL